MCGTAFASLDVNSSEIQFRNVVGVSTRHIQSNHAVYFLCFTCLQSKIHAGNLKTENFQLRQIFVFSLEKSVPSGSLTMAALISFSDFVGFPLKCFKVFGLVPQGEEPIKKWKKIFLKFWRVLGFATLAIPTVFMTVFIRDNLNDLSKIAENLPPYGYAAMVFVKVVGIYRKQSCFKTLLETLDGLFPRTKEEQNIFKVRIYLREYKKVEQVVATCMAIASFEFIALKVFNLAMSGVWFDRKLLADNWFPFDKFHPVWFNVLIVWQTLSSVFLVGGLLGSDLILFCFVTLIELKFDTLSKEMEKLKPSDDKEKFDDLTERHKKLLGLQRDLEEIFSPSILFNFIASSILICLVCYQLSIEISLELLVKFSFILIAALLQVLLVCSCGQKLTNASERVTVSAYNSEWSCDHKKMKTFLVMTMQRAQKAAVLTASKFKVLNLEAFMVVSRRDSDSFTTLIQISH
jgi:odorant receptor